MFYFCMDDMEHKLLTHPDVSEEMKIKLRQESNERNDRLSGDIQKKYSGKKIILSFELFDAWNRLLRTVEITDTEERNVRLIDHRKDEWIERTLSSQAIERIIELIRKAGEKFRSEDFNIEDSNVFDGTIYRIYLSDNSDCYYMIAENFDYHDSERHPNAMILIAMIKAIFSELKSLNVDEKYFRFQMNASDY